jgi:hypothetical protein
MSEFLQSPFAIGVCVTILIAWVLMLYAIFWPPKDQPPHKDEPDVRF